MAVKFASMESCSTNQVSSKSKRQACEGALLLDTQQERFHPLGYSSTGYLEARKSVTSPKPDITAAAGKIPNRLRWVTHVPMAGPIMKPKFTGI